MLRPRQLPVFRIRVKLFDVVASAAQEAAQKRRRLAVQDGVLNIAETSRASQDAKPTRGHRSSASSSQPARLRRCAAGCIAC